MTPPTRLLDAILTDDSQIPRNLQLSIRVAASRAPKQRREWFSGALAKHGLRSEFALAQFVSARAHPEANGFLAVKIPVEGGTTGHSTFMIEFRRNDRWDAGFQRDAVLVHEIRSDGLSYLQNAETNPELLPGQDLRIPSRNWNVKVESFDPVAATAVVTISGFDLVVKYTLDNPENISPQPGTVVVVELSQFLGFTQGSGNPPVFGGVPILKSLIKNRVATQNAGVLTTDFFGLNPSIQYRIRATTVKPEWNVVSNVPWVAGFVNEFPFTIVANGPTNLNLKGAITREIVLH
jgi:hypothetical protein